MATVFLALILSSCLSNISDILLIKNCNEETVKESKTISSAYACILTRLKPKKTTYFKILIYWTGYRQYIQGTGREGGITSAFLFNIYIE